MSASRGSSASFAAAGRDERAGSDRVGPGDRVLLLEPETGRRHAVVLDGRGARKEPGLGVFDPGRLEGVAYGSTHTAGAKRLVVLRASAADDQAVLRRKAQIILPKDLARILFELAVPPGGRVLESGIGSGAATTALAHAVGPDGRVVVQELREDFASWAMDNLARAGLAERVDVHLGDLGDGLAPAVKEAGPFDALLLDLPEPARALPQAWPALAAGARVACYVPQVSQMEAAVRALDALEAAAVGAMELIERAWDVKERGSRPAFGGLGHTGFLVFARKV